MLNLVFVRSAGACPVEVNVSPLVSIFYLSFSLLFDLAHLPRSQIEHCLHILYRTEICAILFYSCLILVAMATPLAPFKTQV